MNAQNVWVLPQHSDLLSWSQQQSGFSLYHAEGCGSIMEQDCTGCTTMTEETALKIGHAPARCECVVEAYRAAAKRRWEAQVRRERQQLLARRWNFSGMGRRIVLEERNGIQCVVLGGSGYLGKHGGKQVPFLRGALHQALKYAAFARHCDGKRGRHVWALADAFKRALLPCVGCPFAPNAEPLVVMAKVSRFVSTARYLSEEECEAWRNGGESRSLLQEAS